MPLNDTFVHFAVLRLLLLPAACFNGLHAQRIGDV